MESKQDVSLKSLNTFGVQARVTTFYDIQSEEDLLVALAEGPKPIAILGGGSNILLTRDIEGSILHINIPGIEIVDSDEEGDLIRVGAGELWHEFVLWTVDNGYYGLENLSLIPGKVGAAPIQNIGAYGVEQEQVFAGLEAIELATGAVEVFNHEECQFGYRDSYFKNRGKGKYAISAVYYRLMKNGPLTLGYGAVQSELEKRNVLNPTPKNVSEVIISIRQSKLPDPKVIGNGGSFFKNPILPKSVIRNLQKTYPQIPSYPVENQDEMIKTSAAWLIDRCGWKGRKIGSTGTYENHALVLVNHGDATGQEIWELAQSIIKDVHDQFGIKLEPEVNVW